MQKEIVSDLSLESVLAVLTVDNIDDSNHVCEALLRGGIRMIELTLRTENAFNIMSHISKNYPDIIIGAGTILSTDQLKKAIQAGASFGVSPGLDLHIVEESKKLDFSYAPGICTPTEIQLALKYDLNILKFFPAKHSGGLDYLKSISTPFIQEDLKYIPLGGLDINSAEKYLHSDLVLAVGGSWIASKNLIEQRDWAEIEDRAKKLRELIVKIRG